MSTSWRWPRRNSAPPTGRRPFPDDLLEHEPPVGGREREPPLLLDDPAGRVAGSRVRHGGGQHRHPPELRVDERAGPRGVRADVPLQLPRGPPRVQAPVLAPERPGQRRAVGRLRARRQRAREPAARWCSASSSAPCRAASASSSGARSEPTSGHARAATIGPVSMPASIRKIVTPASASPAAIVAGIGVAPRWRGSSDGWTFRMPCGGQLEERRRHDLPVVGEDRRGRAGAPRSRRSPRAPGPVRLEHRQAQRLRALGDRRRRQGMRAAGRAIRRRHDGDEPRRRHHREARRGSAPRRRRSRRRSFGPGRPPAWGPGRGSCQGGRSNGGGVAVALRVAVPVGIVVVIRAGRPR